MDLHVVAATDDGKLLHTIRHPKAPGATELIWDPVGDVEGQTGQLPRNVVDTACALDAKGDLHVLVVTDDGHLLHAIRLANRQWTRFGDVEQPWAGDVGLVKAAAATADGVDLHVLVTTGDGKLFHTVRHPKAPGATAFTWDKFQAVKTEDVAHGKLTTLGSASKSG